MLSTVCATLRNLSGLQGKEEGDAAGRRALQEELRDQVAKQRVRMVDQLGRAYATGKRKTSIARVWIRSAAV